MNRLNQLHAEQQEVCSSIWGQQLRRRGHQTESSSILQEDRIYPSIEAVAPKRTNASPYNSRADTQALPMKRLVDQQADLELDSKGNWEPVKNITEERCNMVVFSPVAQQPSSGIEDRLQAIQEILRRSDQQTVMGINLLCDEGCNCRSRSLERQRFDAAFQETKLTEAATDGSNHVVFHRQICLKHDAKVTSNSHRANQGTANT